MSSGKKSRHRKHRHQSLLPPIEPGKPPNERERHAALPGKVEGNFPSELIDRYDANGQLQGRHNDKMFWVESVGAFLLAISVAVVGWQGYLLRDSNRINRQSLEAVQRAFVTFSNAVPERATNVIGHKHLILINTVVQNSGTTPALMAIQVSTAKVLSDEPDEAEFRGDSGEFVPITIGPRESRGGSTSYIAESAIFGSDLDQERPTEIKPILHSPFIWGWIAYKDIFNHPHVTEFCNKAVYFGMNQTETHWLMSACRKHNCTDEYCEDHKEIEALIPHSK